MVIEMKKGIFLSILGIVGLITTFVVWGCTPKEHYIWDGGFYVLLCIIFPIIAINGLVNILTNYYTKDRYSSILDKLKDRYDSSKSISVPVSDLIYYLNGKYLGGDTLLIKYNDNFCILERQVFSNQEKKIFSSIYNLNENFFGGNFDKLLCEPIFDGVALIELDTVEIALINNKYPLPIKEKRIYENVKPHQVLMGGSIILLIFGTLFMFLSFAVDDWYVAISFGGIMLIVGIIMMIILSNKIKKESLVKK